MQLQSFLRTSAEYRRPNTSSSPSPLGDSTNSNKGSSHNRSRSSSLLASLKRHNGGRFSLKGPKSKASATVALSPAIVSVTGTSSDAGITQTSIIPFPSDCMDTDVGDDDDARSCISETCTQSTTGHKRRALRSVTEQIQRKRCVTPLTSMSRGTSTPIAPATGSPVLSPALTRPRSSSLPTTLKPTAKRSKKSKRVVADVQFVAAVHRSIVSRISLREYASRLSEDEAMDVDMEVFGAKVEGDRAHLLEVQERLLADKLWEYLVGLGCSPESLDEPCASSTSPELDADADAPSSPEPKSLSIQVLKPKSQRPSSDASVPVPVSSQNMSPPPSPARVYTMPQLVATMIMRHRERAGRSSGKERKAERARRASLSEDADQTDPKLERRLSGLGHRVVLSDDLDVRAGEMKEGQVAEAEQ